jgi:hypothetical protein
LGFVEKQTVKRFTLRMSDEECGSGFINLVYHTQEGEILSFQTTCIIHKRYNRNPQHFFI